MYFRYGAIRETKCEANKFIKKLQINIRIVYNNNLKMVIIKLDLSSVIRT